MSNNINKHRITPEFGFLSCVIALLAPLVDAKRTASAGAEEMVACLGLVLERLPPKCDVVFLDHQEVYGLMNWDAEKYRQTLNKN